MVVHSSNPPVNDWLVRALSASTPEPVGHADNPYTYLAARDLPSKSCLAEYTAARRSVVALAAVRAALSSLVVASLPFPSPSHSSFLSPFPFPANDYSSPCSGPHPRHPHHHSLVPYILFFHRMVDSQSLKPGPAETSSPHAPASPTAVFAPHL